jgi:hypothetical protein
MSGTGPQPASGHAAGVHAAYAVAFLAGTVASGVWLRTVPLWPASLAGFEFTYLVHAHSHLAFFGWVTPALFALVLRAAPPTPRMDRLHTVHAHAVGVASGLAFFGFLRMGYAPPTIAIASLHVALWVAFVAMIAGRLRAVASPGRGFAAAALGFLLLAGAGAMAPGIVEARGIGDPWLRQMALQVFLTPFTAGWLMLGACGVAYARLARPRFAGWVLALTLLGVMPSAASHVALVPPHAAWAVAGRVGLALLGVAALLFARDALAERGLRPMLRLAAMAAALKGSAEVAIALGIGADLVGTRPLVIGYLHLVLLGLVTPVLLGELLHPLRLRAPALLHGAGLALTLLAMAWMGLPGGYALLYRLGGAGPEIHQLAWAGGVLSAAAVGGALLLRWRASTDTVAPAGARRSPPSPSRSSSIAANGFTTIRAVIPSVGCAASAADPSPDTKISRASGSG